jgi:hypothetical protein
LDLLFGCNQRNKQFYIKKFGIGVANNESFLSGRCSPSGKVVAVESPLIPDLRPSSITFLHFLPTVWLRFLKQARIQRFAFQTITRHRSIWDEVFKGIIHIGPLRDTIDMRYAVTGESPTSVGGRGENLLGVLYQDQRLSRKRRKSLLMQLNKWLKEHFGIVTDINLEAVTRDKSVYALTGLDPLTGVRVNLSQVGFGVSQIAPIIVQGFMSPPGTCMFFEQPEIHLHPAAQADLGDLFIDIMKGGKQLFVETHSEHMILRIRRRIAEGALSSDQVQVLFVKKGSSGSSVEQMVVDQRGQIANWPKGFFEEAYQENVGIVLAAS